MVGDTGCNLDDPTDNPFDRALDLFALHIELTQQMEQVIGQKPLLEPGLVRLELVATGLVPTQGVLAFFDPILHVRPAVIGFHDFLREQLGVSNDEAHPRKKFIQMPLDLADHPARLAPTHGLILEIEESNLDVGPGPTPRRSAKIVPDDLFQGFILREADEIRDAFAFAVIVNPGLGESRVAPEPEQLEALPIAIHQRLDEA